MWVYVCGCVCEVMLDNFAGNFDKSVKLLNFVLCTTTVHAHTHTHTKQQQPVYMNLKFCVTLCSSTTPVAAGVLTCVPSSSEAAPAHLRRRLAEPRHSTVRLTAVTWTWWGSCSATGQTRSSVTTTERPRYTR